MGVCRTCFEEVALIKDTERCRTHRRPKIREECPGSLQVAADELRAVHEETIKLIAATLKMTNTSQQSEKNLMRQARGVFYTLASGRNWMGLATLKQ